MEWRSCGLLCVASLTHDDIYEVHGREAMVCSLLYTTPPRGHTRACYPGSHLEASGLSRGGLTRTKLL